MFHILNCEGNENQNQMGFHLTPVRGTMKTNSDNKNTLNCVARKRSPRLLLVGT